VDPAFQANSSPLVAWAEAWYEADPEWQKPGVRPPMPSRSMLTSTLVKAIGKQAGSARPWSTVRGPGGAVVATLRRLEWKPEGPSVWITDRGELINLEVVSPRSLKGIVDDATERFLAKEWARETGDPTLAAGVWIKPVLKAMAKATPAGAAYLKRVASQVEWTQSRLFTGKRAATPDCPKGCCEIGDLAHRQKKMRRSC
jgi:hypothetical protein